MARNVPILVRVAVALLFVSFRGLANGQQVGSCFSDTFALLQAQVDSIMSSSSSLPSPSSSSLSTANTTDESRMEEYTLCSNTTFSILSDRDDKHNDVAQLPLLVVRPHTRITCEEAQTCVLHGGRTQVMVGSPATVSTLLHRLLRRQRERQEEQGGGTIQEAVRLLHRLGDNSSSNGAVSNVTLQGITFRSITKRNVNAYVLSPTFYTTFQNCLFTHNRAHSLLLVADLEFIYPSDASERQRQDRRRRRRRQLLPFEKDHHSQNVPAKKRRLQNNNEDNNNNNNTTTVVVDECIFENNAIRIRHGYGGLISAFSESSSNQTTTKTSLVLQKSLFMNNEYGGKTSSHFTYLVANTMGHLSLQHNCFLHNTVSLALVLDNSADSATANHDNFAFWNNFTSALQGAHVVCDRAITEIWQPDLFPTGTGAGNASCASAFTANTCDLTNPIVNISTTAADVNTNTTTNATTTTNITTNTNTTNNNTNTTNTTNTNTTTNNTTTNTTNNNNNNNTTNNTNTTTFIRTVEPTAAPSEVNHNATEEKNHTLMFPTSSPTATADKNSAEKSTGRNRGRDALVLGIIIPGIVLLILAMSLCSFRKSKE